MADGERKKPGLIRQGEKAGEPTSCSGTVHRANRWPRKKRPSGADAGEHCLQSLVSGKRWTAHRSMMAGQSYHLIWCPHHPRGMLTRVVLGATKKSQVEKEERKLPPARPMPCTCGCHLARSPWHVLLPHPALLSEPSSCPKCGVWGGEGSGQKLVGE